jgi:hypothetical protein
MINDLTEKIINSAGLSINEIIEDKYPNLTPTTYYFNKQLKYNKLIFHNNRQ